MKKPKIKVGIELECVFNNRVVSLPLGSYHSDTPMRHKGKTVPGWLAETDGSVSQSSDCSWEYNLGDEAEFIMKAQKSLKDFEQKMSTWKNILSKKGTVELKDVVSFNDSCGSHIHISVGDYQFRKRCFTKTIAEARKLFNKLVSESDIESKAKIIKQYNRSYARMSNLRNWRNNSNRRVEWNVTSEMHGKGLEWRSVNLCGIKTWAEFDKMVDIILVCLQKLIDGMLNGIIKEELEVSKHSIRNAIKKIPAGEFFVDISEDDVNNAEVI